MNASGTDESPTQSQVDVNSGDAGDLEQILLQKVSQKHLESQMEIKQVVQVLLMFRMTFLPNN